MSSGFVNKKEYDVLISKIESDYEKTGSLQGLKIKVPKSENTDRSHLKIYDKRLTVEEVTHLMRRIVEKQSEDQSNDHYTVITPLCDQLIKVIEDSSYQRTDSKWNSVLEVISGVKKTAENEKKAQKAKDIDQLVKVISEFISQGESEGTSDPRKLGSIRYFKNSLEKKESSLKAIKSAVLDPSCSLEKFNEDATRLELELLQLVVMFNDQYKGVLIDKLIDLSNEDQLYKIPPGNENALSLAINFKDLSAIERIHEKFPHSMRKFLSTKSGISTPLISAVYYGVDREEIARKLLEYGANINFIEPGERWLLNLCVFSSHASAKSKVEFCLSIPGIDVNIKDSHGRKVLHNISLNNVRDDVVDVLLADRRILDQKNEKDAYGYTPLDYAYFYKNDKLIKALENTQTVNTQDPRYGHEPLKIDQSIIRDKMRMYLESTLTANSDHAKAQIIDKIMGNDGVRSGEGFCNGFTFLYFYYHSKGKKELYFDILRELSKWDGNKETLNVPFEEGRFDNLYANLGDLFQQTLNDVVWFQSVYDIGGEVEQVRKQKMREFQYNTVKNPESDLQLHPEMDILEAFVNKEQLVELLDLFAYTPGLILDLGGGTHSTGLVTLPGGRSEYYDSNAHYPVVELQNNQAAADTISDFKYKFVGKTQYIANEKKEFGYDEVMELHLQMFSFGSSDSETVPNASLDMDTFLQRESPNGFTPLHFAVLCNDKDRLVEILSRPDVDINKKDLQRKTALDYAFLLNRTDLALELLKNPNADLLNIHAHIANHLNASVIKFQNKELLRALLAHPNFIDRYVEDLLQIAIEERSLPFVEVVFQSGKPIEKILGDSFQKNLVDLSLKNQTLEITRCLLKNRLKPTDRLYHWVSKNIENSFEEVKSVIEAMPDPNIPILDSQETLLTRAIKDDNQKLINLLTHPRDSRDSQPASSV